MSVHFSSQTNEWSTPEEFFKRLHEKYRFTLDPSATKENAKCKKFYTAEDDGLSKSWGGETVFCNPPYGRGLRKWVQKAYEESLKPGTIVVMLIPARTDTSYFHDYIQGKAHIVFIRGRLKFGDGKNSAPFPSMLAIYGLT